MSLRNLSRFFFALIACAFLLLSSICSATPHLQNSFKNYEPAAALFQHTLEAPGETALQSSSFETPDTDFSLRHPSPSRLFKKENNNNSFEYHDCGPKFSFVSFNPLLRPAYYHFLFMHNLF